MAKVRKVGVGLAEFWVKIFSGPSWFSSCLFQLEVAFYQEFEAAGPAFHWKVPRAFIWKHLKGTKHFKKHQWNEINQRKLKEWNLLISMSWMFESCSLSLSIKNFIEEVIQHWIPNLQLVGEDFTKKVWETIQKLSKLFVGKTIIITFFFGNF